MIAKILFLFVGLFLQEIITLNALVFATHQGLYPVNLIHAIFLVATIFDIVVGFYIGKFFSKKSANTKIGNFLHKISAKFDIYNNKHKRWVLLFLLGNFSFPYVNSCIAGYLEMPFWESSFFIFIGDIIYYASIWAFVLGVGFFVKKAEYAFIVVLSVAIATLFAFKKIKKKFFRI